MGVSYRLGDAVKLPQTDVVDISCSLQVNLVDNRLISMKDESKSRRSLKRKKKTFDYYFLTNTQVSCDQVKQYKYSHLLC